MASNAYMRPNTKPQTYASETTPNIDANYGPWESQDEYVEYIKTFFGARSDEEAYEFILPGTIIAVYNTPESPETSGITRYIRENGAWRSLESGGRNNSYSNDIYYKNSTCT